MRFPSNRTLIKIAVYGGVASISAVMYMQHKIKERVRKTDYFRLALQTLRQHKGAVGLLGEPIKDLDFDLTEKNNHCDANYAHFEVKVRGSKDKGKMFFWATNDQVQGWLVDRLELELNSQPDRRYLIKKQTTTENNVEAN